jgi:hypothetical protein
VPAFLTNDYILAFCAGYAGSSFATTRHFTFFF